MGQKKAKKKPLKQRLFETLVGGDENFGCSPCGSLRKTSLNTEDATLTHPVFWREFEAIVFHRSYQNFATVKSLNNGNF